MISFSMWRTAWLSRRDPLARHHRLATPTLPLLLHLPTTDLLPHARRRVLADRDIKPAAMVTMRYINRLSAFIIGTIVVVASIIGALAIHETPETCSRLGGSPVKCPQPPNHLDLIRSAIIVGGFVVALLIYWRAGAWPTASGSLAEPLREAAESPADSDDELFLSGFLGSGTVLPRELTGWAPVRLRSR